MFRGSSRAAIFAAAMMGAMSAGAIAPAIPTVVAAPAKAKRRGLFDSGMYAAPVSRWNYGGPGTTMAQQKRASRKAKNVKRHRAHCR